MNDNEKKKMCWNCEGDVHFYALQCPYCGVDLGGGETDKEEEEPDLQDAPYRPVDSNLEQDDVDIPEAPYAPRQPENEEVTEEEWQENLNEAEEHIIQPDFKYGILPLILLLPGAVFLLFSMCLFLFSGDDGFLTLQWRGSFWPFYFVSSIPLIFYGWRSLKKLDKN